jgi:hypothetical protein
MALCCPPGRGCNAPGGEEPCALSLCRAAAGEEEAALALDRWGAFENCRDRERRFRRRAFERARDRALITLAMTRGPRMARAPIDSAMKKKASRRQVRARRTYLART